MYSASGIGTYLRNLLPGLVKSLNKDHNFHLLGHPGELSALSGKNVKIAPFTPNIYSLKEHLLFKRIIPKETDLFWAPHFNIPYRYSGKLLVTIHDVFHLAMPHFLGNRLKYYYAKFLFNRVKKRASAIIAVSKFTQSEITKLVQIPQDKIEVIYNGVNPFWFESYNPVPPSKNPFFLYVGNIKPHKNLRVLIKAFQKIHHQIPHDLILVGQKSGFITGDSKILDAENSMNGRIKFTGRISDELLRNYYQKAQALVFPSLYEGFGLPPLEAMASGCPVLASSRGSIPEICGEEATYFNPVNPDELSHLLLEKSKNNLKSNETLQKRRNKAMSYQWQASQDKTASLIQKLIN